MTIWLTMSRDERTGAIAAGQVAGLDAVRLAKQLKTAPTAITAHAARFGIALADDSRVRDGQPPAGADQRPQPSTGIKQPNDGGRHVADQIASANPEPAPRALSTAPATPDRFDWTPDRTAELRRLVADGHGGTAIAEILGGGLTRNAVIGKIDRLGLKRPRGIALVRAPRPRSPVPPSKPRSFAGGYNPLTREERLKARAEAKAMKPAAPERLRVDLPEPVSLEFSLMALPTGGCKWPSAADDVRELTFCGAPRFAATPASAPQPYCEHHCARAYPPRTTRDRLDRRLARGVSA